MGMSRYITSSSILKALLTPRKAIDAADRYPHATVYGVDLYPPPQDWVPPNCILEGKLFLSHAPQIHTNNH